MTLGMVENFFGGIHRKQAEGLKWIYFTKNLESVLTLRNGRVIVNAKVLTVYAYPLKL